MIDFRLPYDEPIFRALNGLKIPWLDATMVLASTPEFGLICAGCVVLWVVTGLRRYAVRPLLQAGISVAIVDRVGAAVMKPWFDRVRPCFALPPGTFRQLSPAAHAGSMPSLHAANSFAFAVAITLVWPSIGRYIIPVAVLISLSRIFVGVHWPSDVVVGALFGTAVALIVHLIGGKVGARPRPVAAR